MAFSSTIEGPYTPYDEPLNCDLAAGGAIDPDGFTDPITGNRYVVYKVDGNSLGNGGACSNDAPPIVATPILLQQVSSDDGYTAIGPTWELVSNDGIDYGPVIEAPTMFYNTATSTYVLFYSSGCFVDPQYTIKYATASSVIGPYTKHDTPLLVTGSTAANVYIPGGIDIIPDGSKAVFHGDINMFWFQDPASKRVRAMYAIDLSEQGLPAVVNLGGLY